MLAGCLHAHGREGWQDRPLVCDKTVMDPKELLTCQKWIVGVKQPRSTSTCCGEADAYLADAFERGPNGELVAIITKDYPSVEADDGEGTTYATREIKAGDKVVIPPDRLNNGQDPEEGRNPTGHGIVFMSNEGRVLCYFGPNLT